MLKRPLLAILVAIELFNLFGLRFVVAGLEALQQHEATEIGVVDVHPLVAVSINLRNQGV